MLAEVALTPEIHADLRFDALRALTAVAHHAALPVEVAKQLDDLPLSGADAMISDTSPRLLEAAQLALQAAAGRAGLQTRRHWL